MNRLTSEYVENRKEQSAIELAFMDAIPANAKYYNILVALTKLIQKYASCAFKEELTGEKSDL